LKDYAVYGTQRTEPVGSKKPSGLGLYDMSGNVAEWVQGCYEEVSDENCGGRVLRGGSWLNLPVDLRASFRNWSLADGRVDGLGFRLAQDLEP